MGFFKKDNKAQHVEIKCENIVVILDKLENKSVVKMKVELVDQEKAYSFDQTALMMNREIPVVLNKVSDLFAPGNILLLDNTDYLLAHIYSALAYRSVASHCVIAKRQCPENGQAKYVVKHASGLKFKEDDIFDADGNLIPVQEPIVTYN